MLGAHATYPSSLKSVKLHKRQVLMVGILLLVLAGGWWTVQSGVLSGWLPLGTTTAAAGQIVIQQAQPALPAAAPAAAPATGQTQDGQAMPTAMSANTAAAAITTAAGETVTAEMATAETVAAETASTETAATTAAAEAVSLAGVAGVNGAAVWDDAGSLLATLDSGSLVTVQASAGDGAWLSVQTGAGTGWTPASSIIAYGLGRLSSIALPEAVIAAANTSIAAGGADTAAAASTEAGTEVAVTAADASAQTVNAASLLAQVTGAGTRLNIRSGPSTDYGVTAQAEEGATPIAVGRNAAGDWLLLQLSDGSSGWASATYLALSGDLQVLPVVDAAAGA